VSGALVLRAQAGSLAEESLSRVDTSLKALDQIGLTVEGGSAHTLIENAFLELLNRRGVHTTLKLSQGSGKRTLHVTILEQGVHYVSLPSGDFRRDVRTSIEARDVTSDSSLTRYLGSFHRIDVDTVGFREEIGLLPPVRENERTLFDKLVGPVLLIGGAFLIVYLFFTVRN